MDFVVLVFLLVLSALFSGAETALTSVNKLRLESKAKNGDKKARKVLKLVESPDKMLTTILIGNNFVNISLSALATSMMISKFGAVGVVYSALVLTILILLMSEITPKNIASVFPEKVSYISVLPISVLMGFLRPLVFLITKFTSYITIFFSRRVAMEKDVSLDDLKTLMKKGSYEGVFHADEVLLLNSVLDFKDKEVGDVLKTPRVDVVSIAAGSTFNEVREIIKEERFSRYPVYEGDVEHIIGFFHAKDIVIWSFNYEKNLSEFIDKEVLFVPVSKGVGELFKEMQERRKHVALVVDEYGGLKGLISLEDVIEEMIGHEIHDEKDSSENWIEEVDGSVLMCHGDVKIDKLRGIMALETDDEIETLSELVIKEFGEVPKSGNSCVYGGHEFVVEKVERNRLIKIKIHIGVEKES